MQHFLIQLPIVLVQLAAIALITSNTGLNRSLQLEMLSFLQMRNDNIRL